MEAKVYFDLSCSIELPKGAGWNRRGEGCSLPACAVSRWQKGSCELAREAHLAFNFRAAIVMTGDLSCLLSAFMIKPE